MKTSGTISETRKRLSEIADNLYKARQRYSITKKGKTIALMISPEELKSLEVMAMQTYSRLSARQKLQWLEKPKRFIAKFL